MMRKGSRVQPDQSQEMIMLDLIFLAVGIGAFGLFAVYARLLERL
ncbi:MAG: hypothetical protein JWM58_2234 [Rhizobium sp.]|nr:hypothetical protein [Rhizobium sp.]